MHTARGNAIAAMLVVEGGPSLATAQVCGKRGTWCRCVGNVHISTSAHAWFHDRMVKVVNGYALIGTPVAAAAALFHDQAGIMVSHRLAVLVYRSDDRLSYSWYEFRVAMVRRESQQSPRTRSESSLIRYKTMISTHDSDWKSSYYFEYSSKTLHSDVGYRRV